MSDRAPSFFLCYRCRDQYAADKLPERCPLCGSKKFVPEEEWGLEKHFATMNPYWEERRVVLKCSNCSYIPDPADPEPYCHKCSHSFVTTIIPGKRDVL